MGDDEVPKNLEEQSQEPTVETETENEDKKPEEGGEKEPQEAEAVTDVVLEQPSENTEKKEKEETEKKKVKKKKGKGEGEPVESPKKEKGKKKGKKDNQIAEPEKAEEGEEQEEEREEKEETPAGEEQPESSPKKEKTNKEKKGKKKKGSKPETEESEDTKTSPSERPKKAKSEEGQKSEEALPEESGKVAKKEKKKKKEKEGETEDSKMSLEPKDKKKKTKKGKKESESELAAKPEGEPESETLVKKKKKQKKSVVKKVESDIERKVSKVKARSKSDVKQPSLVQLMSKLSMLHEEIEHLKKSVVVIPVDDDYSDSSLSESSEETSEDEETKKESVSVVLHKKKKRKEKKKKDKHKPKEEHEKATEEPELEIEKPEPKKKRTKDKQEKEEPPPQDDVLAEVARMKLLAEAQASGEETQPETIETEPPKKKKKGPKKKLSKKEKARLAAEQAEKARQTAEEEAALAAERERIRLEQERKEAIEKEKRETHEQQIRMEQLEAALENVRALLEENKQLKAAAQAQTEWEIYVNCERLPNPSKCDQMNTFLHLWENTIEETSMEEAARRTKDVLELLDNLDDLIDTSDGKNQEMVENWKWVRLLFRRQQAKSLDIATYRLLRNIEVNLNRIDIPTADYQFQDENLVLSLWLRIQLPVPLPNPRRPPKPHIEVKFPPMKLEVLFPLSIDGEKTAVRALYVKYDHLSDLSDSYEKPPIPSSYDIDLYDAVKLEWREKLLYKFQNRVRKVPVVQESGEEPEPEPEPVFGPDEDIPVVPYRKLEPTPSEHVITQEDELYDSTRANLLKIVPDDVINLRKYSIIGGVYSLHLIHQPPQPQDFVTLEMSLTPLYLPKELEYVDLYLDYDPPPPPISGVRRTPEEIEEEMKKSEEELERLILVTLTWPEHVIFLELPMVCYWDAERRVWSKKEVHDLKHNEEKGQLTFRTRMGGTFALAAYRYANLPYQAWEMRPEANVSLQITAAILMVEFNVKGGQIALSQLQNSPNNALQDITGMYFPLPKLIRMLQNAGVDVFPAFDAFCYVENTCEKHWPMEKHLYFNMAQLSTCFNFAWSRWNVAAGRRGIILQMREYNFEKTKQKTHSMLHVTPLHALFVDCTEVSQTFSEVGIEGSKFYPDLFYLMRGTCSLAVRNKILKAPNEVIVALYELLVVTRVVSFS